MQWCLSVVAVCLLALSGCTELKVVYYKKDEIPKGVPVPLPKSLFEVTLNLTLQKFEVGANNKISLAYSIQSTVEVKAIPDNEFKLFINPEDISSWNKQVTLDIDYHEMGVLETFDLDRKDETVAIATSVANALVSVALANQGIPVASVPKITSKGLKADSETNTIACKFQNPSEVPVLTQTWDYVLDDIKDEKGKLEAFSVSATTFLNWFTIEAGVEKPMEVFEDAIENSETNKYTLTVEPVPGQEPESISEQVKRLFSEKSGAENKEASSVKTGEIDGLPYVTPGVGRVSLLVNGDSISETTLYSSLKKIPEYGQLALIQYSNNVGKANKLTVNFKPSGVLGDVTFTDNVNEGNTLSKGIANIAGALATYKTSKAAAEKTKQTEEEAQTDKELLAGILAISFANQIEGLSDPERVERAKLLKGMLLRLDLTNSNNIEVIEKINKSITKNEQLERLLNSV